MATEFLTINQAAEYLKVSTSYLYKLTSRHRIRFYKPTGKRIYFKASELDEFILNGRVATLEELSDIAAQSGAQASYGRRRVAKRA